ncbi:hypothetical protein J18TS1_33620 [Oceanobacillus oncorhynchi subsp. incaldanensis]|uniref:ester cyclase n=1 Tax=Oceanobacillus oncorhynchi TaxID=545501 RepID=UPI001B11CE53|nr:ester cyclase [Oceanobacillus oncorhynchi]GIO20262.1 hypothetical protein J18TS1_33620 [Oceanobacillus oncorhynchi subsp. incaldanensis]
MDKETAENTYPNKEPIKKRKKKDYPIFYGDSQEVNQFGHLDFTDYIKNLKKTQKLDGFNSIYKDIVHYILTITHKIWEEKSIGYIYDTYHNNVKMHLGSVNQTGINSVIAGTFQTLHAFPDRKLFGENVIWSGNDKDGFYSSHRVQSISTNLGESEFGPATGKKVFFRTTIDCFVHSNRIIEEWLVRDNLYIVEQLGIDPHEFAKNEVEKQNIQKNNRLKSSFGKSEANNGQLRPEVYALDSHDFEIGNFIMEYFNKVWERRLFDYVRVYYSKEAVSHFICDKDLIGYQQIQGMLISFFASFPNAKFIVERVTCNQRQNNNLNSWDVAVRWRILGINEGIGYFGKPSDCPVEILGINHLVVENEQITEEWITFDGLDVLKQIYSCLMKG